ncbi:Uncharacterised protein [Streptococcus pneumoniae]|nr:Uncharacterised protein [Streptococcus pneumoniae]CIW08063.1 Uncharacterised protein [Streptococcus pneumoniae]
MIFKIILFRLGQLISLNVAVHKPIKKFQGWIVLSSLPFQSLDILKFFRRFLS